MFLPPRTLLSGQAACTQEPDTNVKQGMHGGSEIFIARLSGGLQGQAEGDWSLVKLGQVGGTAELRPSWLSAGPLFPPSGGWRSGWPWGRRGSGVVAWPGADVPAVLCLHIPLDSYARLWVMGSLCNGDREGEK